VDILHTLDGSRDLLGEPFRFPAVHPAGQGHVPFLHLDLHFGCIEIGMAHETIVYLFPDPFVSAELEFVSRAHERVRSSGCRSSPYMQRAAWRGQEPRVSGSSAVRSLVCSSWRDSKLRLADGGVSSCARAPWSGAERHWLE